MRCLILGGGGFIGSHLVEALVDLGADVVSVDDYSAGKRHNLAFADLHADIEEDLDAAVRDIQITDHQKLCGAASPLEERLTSSR